MTQHFLQEQQAQQSQEQQQPQAQQSFLQTLTSDLSSRQIMTLAIATTGACLFCYLGYSWWKKSSSSPSNGSSGGESSNKVVPVTTAVGDRNSHSSSSSSSTTHPSQSSVDQMVQSVLSTSEYRSFRLVKKEYLTQGVENPVVLLRFALPREDAILGLDIGHHIRLKGHYRDEGIADGSGELQFVERSYTPVSTNDDKGYFDIVVKLYPMGKMSRYLSGLEIGDSVQVMGPHGRFSYKPNMHKELFMIAGGSGITPVLQVIKQILKNRHEDQTRMTLLYGNISEGDIILRRELEEMQREHSDRFKLVLVLKNSPEGWTHESGFINQDILKKYLPDQTNSEMDRDHVKVLLCGSPTMIKVSKETLLNQMGYNRRQIFTF